MTNAKPGRARLQFEEALARLEQGLALDQPRDIRRDVVILQFVLTFETAWKALRQALLAEQIGAHYAREAFQKAYQAGWLSEEEVWIGMLADRNVVAHTYNEATAERILGHMTRYVAAFQTLRTLLDRRAGAGQGL